MINALGRSEFLGIEPAYSRIDMMRNFRADDLEQRLVRFAIDIVTLIGQLPHNFQAKHIAVSFCGQARLLRPIMAKRELPKAVQTSSIN